MLKKRTWEALIVAAVIGQLVAVATLAQTGVPDTSDPGTPTFTGRNERDPELSTTYDYNDQITRGVSRMIQEGSYECNNLLIPEYRIDCLADVFARASSVIERRPDYSAAAIELRSLSRELKSIVSRHEDVDAPRVTRNRRSYRAVAKSRLAQATQEADAAIDETVSKLLRSVGNSEKRRAHYSQIANAVGSTKVILRSFNQTPGEFLFDFAHGLAEDGLQRLNTGSDGRWI